MGLGGMEAFVTFCFRVDRGDLLALLSLGMGDNRGRDLVIQRAWEGRTALVIEAQFFERLDGGQHRVLGNGHYAPEEKQGPSETTLLRFVNHRLRLCYHCRWARRPDGQP